MLRADTPSNTSNELSLVPDVVIASLQRLNLNSCKGCGLTFDHSKVSILNRNPNNRLLCFGCKKLFSLATRDEVYQRFLGPDAHNEHEARLLKDYYLHKSEIQIASPKSKDTGLYHLPLSQYFYAKRINENGQTEFIYQFSETEKNTVDYYNFCGGCIQFVKTKRKTLRKANQKAGAGGAVASFEELMRFLVDSNSTCAFTGVKGGWSSYPDHPLFLLSLDHKLSLHAGGSSEIDNLQVSLQCLNNVKGNYDSEDFLKWVEAIKQYKGDH